MFTWFWKFLYTISKSLYQLIDGLMKCANMLVGIDPIKVNDEETDLITYLFRNDQITFAFKVCAVVGLIVLVMLSIIGIIRAIVKEKSEDTPGGVAVKAFKSVLLFMFVPFVMIVSINLLNVIMIAIYKATSANSTSLGQFLFTAFAPDYESTEKLLTINWESTTDVTAQLADISDYNFVLSWIACAAIIVNLAYTLITFVDRAISIIILYLAAPFSISSSVVDGGARFKLWRDQVLIKFIMGYGSIIAMNIYCLFISVITPSTVVFFDNSFLNFLMKILIIIGGALSMKHAMSLVGNLVSSGAGSQELREAAMGRGAIMRSLSGLGLGTGKAGIGTVKTVLHPFKTAKSAFEGIKKSFGFDGSPQGNEQLSAQNKTNELLGQLLSNGNAFNGGARPNSNNDVRGALENNQPNNQPNNNNQPNANNDLNNTVRNNLMNNQNVKIGSNNQNNGRK